MQHRSFMHERLIRLHERRERQWWVIPLALLGILSGFIIGKVLF